MRIQRRTKEQRMMLVSVMAGKFVCLAIIFMCIMTLIISNNNIKNSHEVDASVTEVKLYKHYDDEGDMIETWAASVEYSINNKKIANIYKSNTPIAVGDTLRIRILLNDPYTIVYEIDNIGKIAITIVIAIMTIMFIVVCKVTKNRY